MLFSIVLVLHLPGFLEKPTMKDIMEVALIDSGRLVGFLTLRDIPGGFSFPYLSLMNHIVVDDFIQDNKTQQKVRISGSWNLNLVLMLMVILFRCW